MASDGKTTGENVPPKCKLKPTIMIKREIDVTDESSSSSETSSSSDSDSENDSNLQNSSFQNGSNHALPIRRDGMAVCERCGTVGIKHAFYSKTKRFCSLACSRSLPKPTGGKTSAAHMKTTKRPVPPPNSTRGSANPKRPKAGTGPTANPSLPAAATRQGSAAPDLTGSFDWESYVSRPDFEAAPVSCFKHVAMADCWDNITVGMKVEVENKDCENFGNIFPNFYWIATVIKIAGYMTLLRYEGFGMDGSKDFWVNLCTEAVHPVGWCASQGKPLIPPKTIEHKYVDWKEFLVKRLTGARTLPSSFHAKIKESLKSRFRVGMRLEVVDKNHISSIRVASIDETIGGRLHISYEKAENGDEGFWCHEQSPLLHPIGWAQIVGHDLRANPEYAADSLQKTLLKKFDYDDVTWDMFAPVQNCNSDLKFKEGMKLEAIDPLNLSTVCVATVTRVLRNNFLMIGIDGMMAPNGSDWFCYHASSPCIFPVGFCELNNIELTPPRGHKGEFKWFDYLKQTKSVAAPVSLFKKDIPNHGFKEGMHVEAVDLMEPRLICVGTVTKVVGRLLRVHFDGWDVTYDQWCDCESPDLFPVGWCRVVGYRLEPPRTQALPDMLAKKKKKYSMYKGPRRKKKGQKPQVKKSGTVRSKVVPSSEASSPVRQESDNTVTSTSDLPGVVSKRQTPDRTEVVALPVDDERVRPTITKCPTSLSLSNSPGLAVVSSQGEVSPEQWDVLDVAQFLRINECGAYCQIFSQQKITGQQLLGLSKEDIISLTGMKVGPSLKIYDLIQQLKVRVQKRRP